MSIRTVTAMCPRKGDLALGGLDLRGLLADLVYGFPSADAPAFYGDVTVRQYGGGTKTRDMGSYIITQTISYDVTKVFTRIPSATGASFVTSKTAPDGQLDFFSYADPAIDECYVLWGQGKSLTPLPSIGEHHLKLVYSDYSLDPFVVGTESYDNGDLPVDIEDSLFFEPPFWGNAGTPAPGDTFDTLYVWGGLFSVWSVLDLGVTPSRDIRGTYTASFNDSDVDSSWDTNTVTHSVDLTLA